MSVSATDAPSAAEAVANSMYGPRGIHPPAMYAPAMVSALTTTRRGAGGSSPHCERSCHIPDLHMERSLGESGSCGKSRFTKRGHEPDCWLTSVAVCKPMSLGLHAATATRTRPATHCGVRLSPLHNLRTISTFFAQMRQTTPASGGTFFYKCRNILKERCTKCRCFIHRPRGHREWIKDSGEAGCS